jgi:peptide/nickel transport system permease protein
MTTVARRLARHPLAATGAIILAVFTFAALFADGLAPYPPDAVNPDDALAPPSPRHPMGTDRIGRDVLSRIVHGGRLSLRIGLISVAIGGTTGLLLGGVAGYRGGWIDDAIMRVLDVLLAFPNILLALVVVAVAGPGLTNLMIAVGVASIPGFARLVRGSVLAAREHDYVVAARALGASGSRVLRLHLLPNVFAPFLVYATLNVALAILNGSGLSYLGLGPAPPASEWGLMLSDGRAFLRRAWWLTAFPGVAIMLAVMAINLLGDGLRDVTDPRLVRACGRGPGV